MTKPFKTPWGCWILWAVAVVRAAFAITALAACLYGWTTEYLVFALRNAGWAFVCAWVGWLVYDNTRLRSTPLWQAANAAWKRGWEARDKVAQADAKRSKP